MFIKRILKLTLIVIILSSCGGKGYTIKGDIKDLDEGGINLLDVYGHVISSAVVSDGKFEFKGEVDTPCLVYINNALGVVYPIDIPILLENTTIKVFGDASIGQIDITGTKANENMVDFKVAKDRLSPNDKDGMLSLLKDTFEENHDNLLGAMLISNLYNLVSDKELLEYCDRLPEEFLNDPTVSHYHKVATARVSTEPGKQFADFSMTGADSIEVRLSDVVRSNKVTALLFWASWARDASAAIPEITEGCSAYRGEGLSMYCVSLDSDMDKFSRSEREFGIFGHSFANGPDKGDKAASLYGFEGLPRVVLIRGDGTILARGRSFEDIKTSLESLF